jgi:hypothetical protein
MEKLVFGDPKSIQRRDEAREEAERLEHIQTWKPGAGRVSDN